MIKFKKYIYLEYLIYALLFFYSFSLSFIYGSRLNVLTEFELISFVVNIVNVSLIIISFVISLFRNRRSKLIILCLLQLIIFISMIDIYNIKNTTTVIFSCAYLVLSMSLIVYLIVCYYRKIKTNYLYLLFFLLADFLLIMFILFSFILFYMDIVYMDIVNIIIFCLPSFSLAVFYTILIIKYRNADLSISPKFSYYLSFKRKQYNLSQSQLGKYLNISNKMVSKWEKGSLIPSMEHLVAISILFDDDLESIIQLIKGCDYE